MKKTFLLLFVSIFTISLASCGENVNNESTTIITNPSTTTEEPIFYNEVSKEEWDESFGKTKGDKFTSKFSYYNGDESYSYYFGLNLPYAQKMVHKGDYYLDDYGYKIEEDKIITYIRLNEDEEYTISSIEKTDPYELLYSSLPNKDFWNISTNFDDYVFDDGKYVSNQNGKEIEVIFTDKNWAVTESYLWKISIKNGEEVGKISCGFNPKEKLNIYEEPKELVEFDTEMKEYSESFQSIMSLIKEDRPYFNSPCIGYSPNTIPNFSLYEYYDNYVLSLLGSLDYKEVDSFASYITINAKKLNLYTIDLSNFNGTMWRYPIEFCLEGNYVATWFVIDDKHYNYVAECDDNFMNQIVEICDEYYTDNYHPYTRFRKELLIAEVF